MSKDTKTRCIQEELVAEHIGREMLAEEIVDRDRDNGLIYRGDSWDYIVEIRTFRIPKTVRLRG